MRVWYTTRPNLYLPGTCISHGESLTFFKKRLKYFTVKQTRLHVPVICTQYQRYLYCNVMYVYVLVVRYVCTCTCHVYARHRVHAPLGYPH